MSYDPKCFSLALSFLMDSGASFQDCQKLSDELAKKIQKTIEDFMEEYSINT